jgi:hypothetical protein
VTAATHNGILLHASEQDVVRGFKDTHQQVRHRFLFLREESMEERTGQKYKRRRETGGEVRYVRGRS